MFFYLLIGLVLTTSIQFVGNMTWKYEMVTAHKRRTEIVDIIKSQGSVKVDKLVSQFDVSSVTIRHDLNLIEKEYDFIARCHGGAIIDEVFSFSPSVNEKKSTNKKIKSSIGKYAANLINNGDSILLDSGSTVESMATHLNDKENLMVMTNSLNIAGELYNRSNVNLTVLGGNVRRSRASMSSLLAEAYIREHRFDKLFLGADGFDIKMGITTPHQDEAAINRAMCEVSQEVIVIADSSKLEKTSYCSVCELSRVSTLITDSGISKGFYNEIKDMGMNVIIVSH